jgi:hypothetical protein
MKTKPAPPIRPLPVKWEMENNFELPVRARGRIRSGNSRLITLLYELQSSQRASFPARLRGAS